MKTIGSIGEFEAARRAERAVLFLDFAWSRASAASRAVLEDWERGLTASGAKRDWEIHRLSPDTLPGSWKWLLEQADLELEGAVLWLKAGQVAGRGQAAVLGVKGLERWTRHCFAWPEKSEGDAETGWNGDPELLKWLCCPETRQELKLATRAQVEDLNRRIASGLARRQDGQAVAEAVEGGFVRADGKVLYPVRHNIPVLLVPERIVLMTNDQ